MQFEKATEFILNKMRKGLPDKLIYHSLDHTLEVIENAHRISSYENINKEERDLLLTAAAFHDSGLLEVYENHEDHSCEIAQKHLPDFKYSQEEIERIKAMIQATRVPQSPKDHTAKILCDADLSYLGGADYDRISRKLFDELNNMGYNIDEEKWLSIQVNFLEKHHYWTDFAMKHLSANKMKVLKRLKTEMSAPSD